MNLTKYANEIPLQRRMELLNYYPCFSKDMKESTDLISYFEEAVKQWWTDGNDVVLPDGYVDEYEDKLSFLKNYMHYHNAFTMVTVWRDYAYIAKNIVELDKKHVFLNDKLLSLLKMPTSTMEETLVFMKEVSNFALSAEKENDDYYKETMGTVFGMMLPYKFNAIGMRAELEQATFSIHDNDFFNPAFQTTYLSQLSTTFYHTLQGIRGCSLSETKQKLRCLRSVVYMIISELYQEGFCDKVMVQMYGTYISKMLQAGIGENIAKDVCEMVNRKIDWIDVVQDGFENFKSGETHNASIFGNGYNMYVDMYVDEYLFRLIGDRDTVHELQKMERGCIRENLVRTTKEYLLKVFSTENQDLSFLLTTKMMGYLRYHHKKTVVCVVPYPLTDAEALRSILIEDGDVFLLFYDRGREEQILGYQISAVNDPENLGKTRRCLCIEVPKDYDYQFKVGDGEN